MIEPDDEAERRIGIVSDAVSDGGVQVGRVCVEPVEPRNLVGLGEVGGGLFGERGEVAEVRGAGRVDGLLAVPGQGVGRVGTDGLEHVVAGRGVVDLDRLDQALVHQRNVVSAIVEALLPASVADTESAAPSVHPPENTESLAKARRCESSSRS